MSEQLVKKTTSGKFRIVVKSGLKSYFKNLLELFINDQEKVKLDTSTVDILTHTATMSELYLKNHTLLSMANNDGKITLTLSQAYSFWFMCQLYDDYAYMNPTMGTILLQLHQKLS